MVTDVLHGPLGYIASRFDATSAGLERIETSVNVGRHVVEHQHAEANLLLDGLVREVARLQMQIESLRESIDEFGTGRSLTVVGDEDAGVDPAEQRAG